MYKCCRCKKRAVYNYQNWNHLYEIDKKGEYTEIDDWEGNESSFYCEKCAQEEGLI